MGVNCGSSRSDSVPDVYYSCNLQFPLLQTCDFEMQRIIGTGNYSQVRLARLHGQPVAVKVMNKALLYRQKQVQHVLVEKQVLRLLRSPFVVSLLGTCQDEVDLFCVMEYVAGGELFKVLVKRCKLPKVEACFYLSEVVQALCCLHAVGCLYRDIKPENVLLTAEGHVKLADLGFAKLLSRNERTFTMCGTPEYIAPELINGSGCGLELDWWQVGVLLYEMLAGKTPFMDSSPYRLYEKVLTASPNLSYRVFDEDSCSLLQGLLAKLPQQRLTQAQILAHPFFRSVRWLALLHTPPPFVPVLTDPFDTSCFDVFEEKHSEERLDSDLQQCFEGY